MWGMGTRTRRRPSPTQEAWMPKRAGPPDPNARVDPRFRGLKLRKRRSRDRDGQHTGLVVLVAIFVLLALFLFSVDLGF